MKVSSKLAKVKFGFDCLSELNREIPIAPAPHKFVVIDGHIYVPKDAPRPKQIRRSKYLHDLFALKPGLNEVSSRSQAQAMYQFWKDHKDDPEACPAGMKLATFRGSYVVVL